MEILGSVEFMSAPGPEKIAELEAEMAAEMAAEDEAVDSADAYGQMMPDFA